MIQPGGIPPGSFSVASVSSFLRKSYPLEGEAQRRLGTIPGRGPVGRGVICDDISAPICTLLDREIVNVVHLAFEPQPDTDTIPHIIQAQITSDMRAASNRFSTRFVRVRLSEMGRIVHAQSLRVPTQIHNIFTIANLKSAYLPFLNSTLTGRADRDGSAVVRATWSVMVRCAARERTCGSALCSAGTFDNLSRYRP